MLLKESQLFLFFSFFFFFFFLFFFFFCGGQGGGEGQVWLNTKLKPAKIFLTLALLVVTFFSVDD